MYVPSHFQEVDTDEIASIVSACPLATVVAHIDAGMIANPIPLLMTPDGDLIGHVALANDMHRVIPEGADVLAVFQGDDGYITPNSYPTKAETHHVVPTWNYQVVQMHGTIQFQHDDPSKRSVVGLLTRDHERRVNPGNVWRMGDAPADFMQEMLDGIVAFRISVTQTIAKSKLSQNRETRDIEGAIAGLRQSGQAGIADQMKRHLAKQPRD